MKLLGYLKAQSVSLVWFALVSVPYGVVAFTRWETASAVMFEQLLFVYKLSKATLQAHAVLVLRGKMRWGVKTAPVYRGVYSLADCLAPPPSHTHIPDQIFIILLLFSVYRTPFCTWTWRPQYNKNPKIQAKILTEAATNQTRFMLFPLDLYISGWNYNIRQSFRMGFILSPNVPPLEGIIKLVSTQKNK